MREADMMSTDFPFNCLVCVNEMDAGVVESCGKFDRVLPPGCHFICYPYQILKAHVSLKIQQLEVVCETKTKDNVFISVVVVGINAYKLCIYLWIFNSIFLLHSYESLLTIVQYRVVKGKVPSAHYKLTDPASQIRSYVFDVIRSSLPRMDLDDAFASKNDLAEAVQNQLQALMKNYGYEIIAALVVDLDPNIRVKAAMNEINASQRLREAAVHKAEGEKILFVKAAEADAESKYLSGLGVAKQRKAIVDGLKDTMNGFASEIEGTGPQDVIELLLLTQYFDMMKEIGGKSKTGNTLFLPHGPQSVNQLRGQLKDSFRIGVGKKNAPLLMDF